MSTEIYIRKLAESHPEFRARQLHMERRGESHVMALVTNREGAQFARDEYSGVHDLKANEQQKLADDELAKRALKAHSEAERKNPFTPVTRAETKMQLRDAAERVNTLLPESKIWKTSEGAFVTWSASPSEVFVYVGDRGTMTIEPKKNVSEQQLATALARGLQLGTLQQQQTTQTRQTAVLSR